MEELIDLVSLVVRHLVSDAQIYMRLQTHTNRVTCGLCGFGLAGEASAVHLLSDYSIDLSPV